MAVAATYAEGWGNCVTVSPLGTARKLICNRRAIYALDVPAINI